MSAPELGRGLYVKFTHSFIIALLVKTLLSKNLGCQRQNLSTRPPSSGQVKCSYVSECARVTQQTTARQCQSRSRRWKLFLCTFLGNSRHTCSCHSAQAASVATSRKTFIKACSSTDIAQLPRYINRSYAVFTVDTTYQLLVLFILSR